MVAINLESFGGMVPATDPRLLPNNQAAYAQNTWVYSGTVHGLHRPVSVFACQGEFTKKVYRIPYQFYDKEHIVDSHWMEFQAADTDVVRSPTINDSFDRYYWANAQNQVPQPPMYNTRERIFAGDPAFRLGVPAPSVAPVVTGVTGGAAPTASRAYVYTWITAYGEESAPSPPVSFTGNDNGTWNLTLTAPGPEVTDDRNLAKTRIYRTVTSAAGSATYYFVGEVDIETLTFADSVPSTTVAGGNTLQSIYWTEPPEDLEGMCSMPNGMIAGWRGKEVWFCEPYRPHAWPSVYTVGVEFPIVGMGVIGQTLIVCTTGNPFAISGINPAQMAISRIAQFEPCLSRGSIVSTPRGVVYASSNGLALANPGSVDIISRGMIGKDSWQTMVKVPTLRGAVLNGGYYAWGSVRVGCFSSGAFQSDAFAQDDYSGSYSGLFTDFTDTRVAYHQLVNQRMATVNVMMDHWTSEVFLLRDGTVYWLDISTTRMEQSYVWRSKVFNMRERKNLGAARVWFDQTSGVSLGDEVIDLHQELGPNQYGLFRVYADDQLIYTKELRKSGELLRLPSDSKYQYYQFEVEARVEVSKIEVASTVKELAAV